MTLPSIESRRMILEYICNNQDIPKWEPSRGVLEKVPFKDRAADEVERVVY